VVFLGLSSKILEESRKYVMPTCLQVLCDSLLTTIQPYMMCETDGVLKPSKNKFKKTFINHRSLKVHLLLTPYKINHL